MWIAENNSMVLFKEKLYNLQAHVVTVLQKWSLPGFLPLQLSVLNNLIFYKYYQFIFSPQNLNESRDKLLQKIKPDNTNNDSVLFFFQLAFKGNLKVFQESAGDCVFKSLFTSVFTASTTNQMTECKRC